MRPVCEEVGRGRKARQPMSVETKAIIYGLLLALAAPLTLLLFPVRVGDAFTCFAEHVAHLASSWFGGGAVGHPWSSYQSRELCLWLVSALLTVAAGLGLLSLWVRAKAGMAFRAPRRWPVVPPSLTDRRTVRTRTTTAPPPVVLYRKPRQEERRAA